MVEERVLLSSSDCENMASNRVFVTQQGTAHKIEYGRVLQFSANEVGQVVHLDSGEVSCVGQDAKSDGKQFTTSALEVTQYTVLIQPTSLIQSSLGRMETMGEHIRLPISCTLTRGYCSTYIGTWIWDPFVLKTDCAYRSIKTVNLTTTLDKYSIDHGNKIVLKLTGDIPPPDGCPEGRYVRTEYSDLLLTEIPISQFQLVRDQFDIPLMLKIAADYIMFDVELKFRALVSKYQNQICTIQYNDQLKDLFPLDSKLGIYGKIQGDVLFVVTCPQKMGQLVAFEGDRCLLDIPVLTTDQDKHYIDVRNRLRVPAARPTICNKFYPLKVLSSNGKWVEISNIIKESTAPAGLNVLDHSDWNTIFTHEDFSRDSTLYSESENSALTEVLNFGYFHDAILFDAVLGTCTADGPSCRAAAQSTVSQSRPSYAFNKINFDDIPAEIERSLLEKYTKFITPYAAMLDTIVIAGWLLQLVICVIMLGYVGIKQGWRAAGHGLFSLLCFAPLWVLRALDKQHRQRKPEMFPLTERTHTSVAETEGRHPLGCGFDGAGVPPYPFPIDPSAPANPK